MQAIFVELVKQPELLNTRTRWTYIGISCNEAFVVTHLKGRPLFARYKFLTERFGRHWEYGNSVDYVRLVGGWGSTELSFFSPT